MLEPLSGYLVLGQALLAGKPVGGSWNFGPAGDATLSVRDLAAGLAAHWPGLQLAPSPGPHPHEAQTLRLDCGKAERELGWRPVWNAATTIERTARWYRAHYERGEQPSATDLRDYVADARAAGLAWAA